MKGLKWTFTKIDDIINCDINKREHDYLAKI